MILDLLFPIECLGCQAPDVWLCPDCRRKLPFQETSRCFSCYRTTQYGEFCRSCQPGFFLSGIWVAGDYKQPIISKLVKTYKYRFSLSLAPLLSDYLCFFLRDFLNKHRFSASDLFMGLNSQKLNELKYCPRIVLKFNHCLVIPAPLHKKRRDWRGFNQTEPIALGVASNFGLRTDSMKLIRLKHKRAQAKLKTGQRLANLKNNFLWTGGNLSGQDILLIDDVATTGSTLNECARALKKAGANEVWGLVIAKG